MEFTKDIHFSNILRANKTSEIIYSGELYTKNSQSVSIVYGFGENWEHTNEKEMSKTDTGFSTNIEMKDGYDTFNFCFRNGNYEWDNNHTFNYISAIQPAILEKESTENCVSTTEEASIDLDVEFILEVLDNLLEENFRAVKNINTENVDNKQQILEDILAENDDTVATHNSTQEFDMDELVEELLNPVVNFETTINETSTEPVSNYIEPSVIDEIFEKTFNSPVETENETKNISSENVSKEETTTALTTTSNEDTYLVSPRKLRKFYLLGKKIKLAFYKLFISIPKLLSGNFEEDKN